MGILVTLILNFYYETSETVLFNVGFKITDTSLVYFSIFVVILFLSVTTSHFAKKFVSNH